MTDITLCIHTHKNLYRHPCDWMRVLATVDVEGADKIAQAMLGTRLDEFDSIAYASGLASDYVGVCHYRRRPVFTNITNCTAAKVYIEPTAENLGFLCSPDQKQGALDILKNHDVIQYRPCSIAINYRQQFAGFHDVRGWDIMMDVLTHLGMGGSIDFYTMSNYHVWASLFIAPTRVVADFIRFALNVARLLGERQEYSKLLEANPRLTALLLERLTPLWVFHHRLRSAYVPMIILEPEA